MIILIVLFSAIIFIIGYIFYGGFVARRLEIDPSRPTPAHEKSDGVDYVPARKAVLLGHHFASIAGAAPIIGPITAAVFGWVPVLLWIVIGGIFMGAVHDFTSLIASVRHKGKSIGMIIEDEIGSTGKILFLLFSWATIVLVIAVFTVIVAQTFTNVPSAASASLLFMIIAIAFGFVQRNPRINFTITSIIGVILLFVAIGIGLRYPLQLSQGIWTWILLGYIFIASVTPVWVLLQPRDYLNSFMLYAMLLVALAGILTYKPALQSPAFTQFSVPELGTLFPILFVTVACGAISGFHSLVTSGTSAKQLNNESDAKLVGYGGMLIECFLAVIALVTAITLTKGNYLEMIKTEGPVAIFSKGIGEFATSLGLPRNTGISFVALAVSAFALTSLDTATRLGRYAFQEFFDRPSQKNILHSNRYISTIITIIPAALLAFSGKWKAIWPIFGSANQLLAALALLAITVWLINQRKNAVFTLIPMLFMMAITLSGLGTLVYHNLLIHRHYELGVIGIILFVVAIILSVYAWKKIRSVRAEYKIYDKK
ncbi:carbon starvation protein A [bacterium]|nr:carbon starvation protein A [bacterium]